MESAFKALGVAMRQAVSKDESAGVPSTKGVLAWKIYGGCWYKLTWSYQPWSNCMLVDISACVGNFHFLLI